jgi:hypothetical protein
MYLPIPVWFLFAFLTVAAFAPVAGRWPRWWVVYYGALLVCWAFVSVVAFRRAARANRMRQRKLDRLFRQHRNAQKTGWSGRARLPSHARLPQCIDSSLSPEMDERTARKSEDARSETTTLW